MVGEESKTLSARIRSVIDADPVHLLTWLRTVDAEIDLKDAAVSMVSIERVDIDRAELTLGPRVWTSTSPDAVGQSCLLTSVADGALG